MALNNTRPTLVDLAKQTDNMGNLVEIIELLQQESDMLKDMVWKEANQVTGEMATVRTGLPTPTWRKFNQGVQPTKSLTAQITFNTGMLEDYSEVDVSLAEKSNNVAEFRLNEDMAHLEGFGQQLQQKLIFGNEGTAPEEITGLASFYNSLSANNAENIIVGGGAGADNNSIWLVGWDQNKICGVYPRGSKVGFQMNDKGIVTIQDTNGTAGARMEAYQTHYKWDVGLAVKDWRYAVRIPNIDKSLLSTVYTAGAFATGADLSNLMFEALSRIPVQNGARLSWYMSRDTLTKLRQQASAKTQASTLGVADVGGEKIETFLDIPLRRIDALDADEALVS